MVFIFALRRNSRHAGSGLPTRSSEKGVKKGIIFGEKTAKNQFSFSFSTPFSDFIRKTTIGKAMMDMVAEIGR